MYVAERMPGGWTLLGEISKIVPVSAQRITKIVAGEGSATITVSGVSGEKVTMAYLQFASTTVNSLTCVIGTSGSATMELPTGKCA